jgi:hypothetical protein
VYPSIDYEVQPREAVFNLVQYSQLTLRHLNCVY